jgi:anti-sigma-K factor RskA
MTVTPDDELDAAEYALGSLDGAERTALDARRLREADLDAVVVGWERRLAPLLEAVPAVTPPRDYLPEIEARLDRPANDNFADLGRRLRLWRGGAIAASVVAALLAVALGVRETQRLAAPHEYVAVLQSSADQPAFMVTVNLDQRSLIVRPVAAPSQADKAYELWIIDAKLGAPRSLGVIDQSAVTASPRLAGIDPAVVEGATYAVTVEPPGGSPTGQPTSAPIFVGKLIPTGR